VNAPGSSGSAPPAPTKTRAAAVSILSNSLLIALKLAAGLITGSIAIVTEAIHSSIDLLASVIAFFSVRKADEPADESHPYGHQKVENLAAAIEGLLVLVGAEVIVFESPYQKDEADRGNDPTPTLVKRMVGMPGDTLFMRAGLLHVNGVAQRQGFGIVSKPDPRSGVQPTDVNLLFDWQHRVELKQSRFGPAPTQPQLDNWGPLVIPAGHYFMMGDNRYESKDSRFWGTVPRENIRGRPSFVYYSYRSGDETVRPLPFITDIRWGRIGTRIH